jgi:hypothetical protein
MNTSPPDNNNDPSDQTGVADVRIVRDNIAALYDDGSLRRHVAETDAIVEPLIDKLGLKRGVPPRKDDRRSGTEG